MSGLDEQYNLTICPNCGDRVRAWIISDFVGDKIAVFNIAQTFIKTFGKFNLFTRSKEEILDRAHGLRCNNCSYSESVEVFAYVMNMLKYDGGR